jgi:hypothetical protein
MRTRPFIAATRLTVLVFLESSCAAKMAVLVSPALINQPFASTAPNGSDISDFLIEEVKGPGSFECVSGKGCSFEEPAMNQLINDIFGDKSITLDCESGECLHYTQVPGYTPAPKEDNSILVAVSAAAAGAVFLVACLRELLNVT